MGGSVRRASGVRKIAPVFPGSRPPFDEPPRRPQPAGLGLITASSVNRRTTDRPRVSGAPVLFAKALSLYGKGSVPAGRLAIAIMGRRAKLNGLDAPTKIAPTDPTGEHPADTGAIDVNTLSEDTLRRVLRDEKRDNE